MDDLLLGTLIVTCFLLLLFGGLLLPFRKWICAWLGQGKRRLQVLPTIFVLAYSAVMWMQFYAPPLGIYNSVVARYWMRKAAELPARADRETRVRHMAQHSEYGMHIAWSAVRHVPEVSRRCEMWEMVLDLGKPPGRMASYVGEYRKHCAALPDPVSPRSP